MYAAMRRGKARPGASINEVARRIDEEQVPAFRKLAGFVAYSFMKIGDDEGMSITIFETKEAAEEANRLAFDWAKQRLADLTLAPPQTSEGEVLIHVVRKDLINK